MNFEKRMKKHIDQTLDEIVPNPYPNPKKPGFPFWVKFVIPATAVALAATVTAVVLVPNMLNQGAKVINPGDSTNKGTISRNPDVSKEPKSYINLPNEGYLNVAAPKAKYFPALDIDASFVKRTAVKTLENFDSFFNDPKNKDFVVSPMSYLLSVGGVIAVSDGYNLDEFGLQDPEAEVKELLEITNGAWNNSGNVISKIDSGIFHQQVGGSFPFVDEKREAIAADYMGTGVANLGNYLDQAAEYFKEAVKLEIPIPDPHMVNNGIVTYGAVKVMDIYSFDTESRDFTVNGKTTKVDAGIFGLVTQPTSITYFENEQYLAFKFNVSSTDMLIVLPQEGVSVDSINVSEAYYNYLNSANNTTAYGYVPYFHNKTLELDITNKVKSHMSGDEILYSKLMEEGVKASRLDLKILQSTDFLFDEHGIIGESITVHAGSGAGGGQPPSPREILVDRPFYAVTLMNNFPLFVNKVTNPSHH